MFRIDSQPTVNYLFDGLWESVIKRCIIPEGKRQLTNDQLTAYIARKMRIVLHDCSFREQLGLSPDEKDNTKANNFRMEGNRYMDPSSLERLCETTIYYNKSIACAEKGSEERAIAYANRSVVCFQLCQYKDCLENIRLARESNYPDRLVGKLNRREASAKKALLKPTLETVDQEEVVKELELSYKCNAQIPQMVNCLELRRNEVFGRHIVTNRQLKVGDVLIIEKPFASIPSKDFRFSVCAYCHVFSIHTLIPCEGCTITMYCSEECLSKAHQVHRYECAVVRDIRRICDNEGMLALQTVAKAIALFDQDLEAMMKHLNNGLDESKVNAFAIDWRTATPMDAYNTVHVLSTNQTLRSRKNLALQIYCATIVHHLMLERTELRAICVTNAEKSKLFDLILHHWQIAQVNDTSLCYTTIFEVGFDCTTSVCGIFPLISMLNHSCVPNVMHFSLDDGRCAVVALSPIAAGEQLFNSYLLFADEQETSARLTVLKEFYQFTCRCDACELAVDDDDAQPNDEEEYFIRRIRCSKTNSKLVSELTSYLNAAGRYFPPCKLSRSQVMLKSLLEFMYGALPVKRRTQKINERISHT